MLVARVLKIGQIADGGMPLTYETNALAADGCLSAPRPATGTCRHRTCRLRSCNRDRVAASGHAVESPTPCTD